MSKGAITISYPPPDNTAYNEATWNNSRRAPTKGAIRDQIENMLSGPYTSITDPALNAAVTMAIVDAYAGTVVTLTGAGNAQTISAPSASRVDFTVINNDTSTDNLAVDGIDIEPGRAQKYVYDGSAWIPVEAVDAGDITFIPVGGITETNTQGAVAGVDNRKADLVLFTDADQPNGFVNRTDSSIVWSDAGPDRTLTIDKTNGSWSFYVVGTKFTKTAAETIQITDVEGLHYIYYDNTGTLQETTTFTNALMTQDALVVIVYWDATNNIGELMEERHGINMSGGTRLYLHHLVGAAYQSPGLGLGDFVVDGDGSSNTHAQFSVAAGEIHDEDIEHVTNAINSTTGLEVWYLDGANWRKTTNAGYSVLSAGGGNRLAYNNAGAQTEVTDNRFVLTHVFAWGAADGNPIAIQGQAQYTSLSAARDGVESEIAALNISGLPGIEMKAIGSIIFQTKDTYGNAVKARVRSTDAGDSYIDFRTSPLGTGTPVSEHSAFGGLEHNDHPQYLQKYKTIYIPANQMTPTATNGPTAGTWEFTTNDVNVDFFAFDNGTEEFVEFEFPMPEDWDLGTIKAKGFWSSATGSTAGDTIEIELAAGAQSDDDAIDAALGTGQVISDTLLANSGADRQVTDATSAITVGGTPALAAMVHFKVSRNISGTDDMVEDMWLFGIWIQYQTLPTFPAAW